MPNRITNNVVATGSVEDINEYKALVLNTDSDTTTENTSGVDGKPLFFDFSKLVPVPDYIFTGSLGPEEREKYGKNNWYDWNTENWGTKWNSTDLFINEDDDNTTSDMTFNTARSTPMPIWHKLKNLFPNIKFVISYADEDIGANCGIITIEDGELSEEDKEGDDEFAYTLIYGEEGFAEYMEERNSD